jgi:hypothetical protein
MPGSRWLAIQEETSFNESPNFNTPDRFLAYTDLDINPDKGTLYVEESTRRERSAAVPGPFTETGTFTMLLRPDTCLEILKWTMGAHNPTASGTGYKHTYTVANTIKSFAILEVRNDISGLEGRAITGCQVKKLTIEAPAREICTLEVEVLAAQETLIASASLPSLGALSSLRPCVFADGSVSLAGSPLANVESFKFTFDNSIPDDTHDLGSIFIQTQELERLSMVVEMDLKFKSWAARKLFYGTGSPTTPQKNPYAMVVSLTLTSEEYASGEDCEVVITGGASVLTENPAGVKGQERLTQKVSMEVIYSANTKIEVTCDDDYEVP